MTKAAPKDVEAPDFIDVIIKRAERGDVFTIDKNGKVVAVVLPGRYMETLQENFNVWNDGRLVVTDEGHGWRRVWSFLKWALRNFHHTVQNQPGGPYEAEAL